MENKRSNPLKTTIIKRILFVVLYFIASFCTCTGIFAFYTAIAHVGRLIEVVLPITTISLVPLFLLIMARRYKNAIGRRMKWKIGLGTFITTTVVSLYSLISCSIIGGSTHGIDGILTLFFPIDIIVVDSLILAASLLGLGFFIHNRPWFKEKKQPQQVKEYINILVGIYLFAATFSFGAILKCPEILVGADTDHNLPWVMANYFMLSLPTIGIIFRLIYKYLLKPSAKRTGWMILVSTFSFLVVAFYVWLFIGFAINPYYMAQSLQSVYIGGYLFTNMPGEIFAILITCITAITVSSVLFIKNGRK